MFPYVNCKKENCRKKSKTKITSRHKMKQTTKGPHRTAHSIQHSAFINIFCLIVSSYKSKSTKCMSVSAIVRLFSV